MGPTSTETSSSSAPPPTGDADYLFDLMDDDALASNRSSPTQVKERNAEKVQRRARSNVDVDTSDDTLPSSLMVPDPQRALNEEVKQTLTRELEQDMKEHATAPLVPPGWTMYHAPGSRIVYLKRQITTSTRAAEGSNAIGEVSKSPLDSLLRLKPHASPLQSDAQKVEARRAAERKFLMDRLLKGSDSQASKKDKAAAASALGGANEGAEDEVLLDITIYCPFQSIDPSFYDSSITLAEWVPFDVRIVKTSGRTSTCIFARFASVDNELRLRWLQVLPCPPAVAASASKFQRQSRSISDSLDRLSIDVLSSVDGITSPSSTTFVKPGDAPGAGGVGNRFAGEGNPILENRDGSPAAAERGPLSAVGWTEEERFRRDHIYYRGPAASDLSSTLYQFLMEWFVVCVGLNPLVIEYICQSCYVSEHNEYLAWLGQLDYYTSADRSQIHQGKKAASSASSKPSTPAPSTSTSQPSEVKKRMTFGPSGPKFSRGQRSS